MQKLQLEEEKTKFGYNRNLAFSLGRLRQKHEFWFLTVVVTEPTPTFTTIKMHQNFMDNKFDKTPQDYKSKVHTINFCIIH